MRRPRIAILLAAALLANAAYADSGAADESSSPFAPPHALLDEADEVSRDTLRFLRTLFRFEESLLYPATEQLVVFVSVAAGVDFEPTAVTLRIDGRIAQQAQYDNRDRERFLAGGVHRLHAAYLSGGSHALEAEIAGREAKGTRTGTRRGQLTLEKSVAGRFAELRVGNGTALEMRQWQ